METIYCILNVSGGIGLVLNTMRRHVNSHSVQDCGFACMRNICLHQDNRLLVEAEGGIATLLTHMAIYLEDAAIQAYGCDALGRLATEPKNHATIQNDNGVGEVLRSLIQHPGHPGVQDRACFFLLAMSEYEPSLVSMKDKDALSLVREARGRIPNKELAKQRVETLIARLEKGGWFNKRK